MLLAGRRGGTVILVMLLSTQLRVASGAPVCHSSDVPADKEPGFVHTRSQSLMQLSTKPSEKASPHRASLWHGVAELLETGSTVSTVSELNAMSERGVGNTCSDGADCGWHASCTLAGKSGHCEALPLFTMPSADLLFACLAFFIAGISLAAGVGGGGLFVPMLMLMLSFDARTATGLSQSMLLGGAVAAFAYNLQQSHPVVPSRPLIDFELTCLLGPALMSGAQIGSLVHAVAPPAVLLFLLCMVLFDSARKGVASALKMRAKELEAAEASAKELDDSLQASRNPDEPFPEPAPAIPKDADLSSDATVGPSTGGASSSTGGPFAPRVEAEEQAIARVRRAQYSLVGLWCFTCTMIVTKGLFLEICTAKWWSLVIFACVCLLGFALHFAYQLSSLPPANAESLDFSQLAFPLVRWSLFAGILAALCGIGGGMVMGPILVQLRVPPSVSSATTATTLLLISSSTALVYGCRGLVPVHYSLFLSLITACGAFTGKSLIGAWVRRTGRDSVIVWCLAGITVMSTVLMGALGLYRVLMLGRSAFMLSSLCNPDIPLHHLDGPTTGMKEHSA